MPSSLGLVHSSNETSRFICLNSSDEDRVRGGRIERAGGSDCSFFNTASGCLRGESCLYRHTPDASTRTDVAVRADPRPDELDDHLAESSMVENSSTLDQRSGPKDLAAFLENVSWSIDRALSDQVSSSVAGRLRAVHNRPSHSRRQRSFRQATA